MINISLTTDRFLLASDAPDFLKMPAIGTIFSIQLSRCESPARFPPAPALRLEGLTEDRVLKVVLIACVRIKESFGCTDPPAVTSPQPHCGEAVLLSGIRSEGNWEAWISFFLDGITATAEADRNIVEIATLVAADRRRLLDSPKSGSAAYRLFEMLPLMPRFTVERARQKLVISFPTIGHREHEYRAPRVKNPSCFV
jgi:hypothetical protein